MRFILITSVLVLTSLSLFAQDGPKVVVFNQSDQGEPTNTKLNLLKLSLLEPLSGDISIYYERVIGRNTSIEGGLGFTIDDYFGSILLEDDLIYGDNTNRNQLIGYSFGLGFRYYPFVASDEFYFAPEIKYRYYHSEFLTGNIPNQTTYEESKNFTNLRVTAGYTYFFDDQVMLEFYGGLGLVLDKRKTWEEFYNETTFQFEFYEVEKSGPRPWLTLGLKFGFGF